MSNLKFDIAKPNIDFSFDKGESRVLLAGSTHSGEDEIVLSVFDKLKKTHTDLKLILAPRHLTRINEVKKILENYNYKYEQRSMEKSNLEGIDILILDTLGELGKMYNFSDISFIGGSFNKTGGHNPLESIVFEKPVISGPSTHNFKDIYSIIKKAEAGFIVNNETEFYNLANKMLCEQDFYDSTVEKCKKVFEEQQGALDFVINKLKSLEN
jgi:3-deoxy-D-manno-octulosonic-acid transferase